jgi:hypothetical protein
MLPSTSPLKSGVLRLWLRTSEMCIKETRARPLVAWQRGRENYQRRWALGDSGSAWNATCSIPAPRLLTMSHQ